MAERLLAADIPIQYVDGRHDRYDHTQADIGTL
jgi:hypothetical protein